MNPKQSAKQDAYAQQEAKRVDAREQYPAHDNTPLYEGLLDNSDMQRLFHVSSRTLYNWRQTGEIEFIQIRGKFYYLRHCVNAMLIERKKRMGNLK